MSLARIASCSLRMFDTRPSIESTASAESSGLNSDFSCGFVWIGLTRSESLTSTRTSCVRLYLASAKALDEPSSVVATITSFSLDMAIPFSQPGTLTRRRDEAESSADHNDDRNHGTTPIRPRRAWVVEVLRSDFARPSSSSWARRCAGLCEHRK